MAVSNSVLDGGGAAGGGGAASTSAGADARHGAINALPQDGLHHRLHLRHRPLHLLPFSPGEVLHVAQAGPVLASKRGAQCWPGIG